MISYHELVGGKNENYAWGFLPAYTENVKQTANGISKYVWSPCIWEGGRRKQIYFQRANWLVLDFDSGEMSLAQAINIWCDAVHIIGTTRNHQKVKDGKPACDRFRVALRLDKVIDKVRDYRFTVTTKQNQHPVDKSPKDGARYFFPCKEIVSICDDADGYLEPALVAPPDFERTNIKKLRAYGESKVLPKWARSALANGAPHGARHTTCYRLGANLIHMGMSKEEIIAMVLDSPLAAIGENDVMRAVGNGVDRALTEAVDDDECVQDAGKTTENADELRPDRQDQGASAS